LLVRLIITFIRQNCRQYRLQQWTEIEDIRRKTDLVKIKKITHYTFAPEFSKSMYMCVCFSVDWLPWA